MASFASMSPEILALLAQLGFDHRQFQIVDSDHARSASDFCAVE